MTDTNKLYLLVTAALWCFVNLAFQDNEFGGSILVQSLRSDPFRHFHMAVLAAYPHPNSKRDIIKVNLVESC
nr:uncharacterized protein LOC109189160 isoform X1 [Ipomoea batatas]GMD82837.1 uncharacterized protein LOC109189160 isoform X1 [Ipomoea batatas]GME16662.1 uncharacterized protein LOC109189160 isoform X1 [Ipomoea batatas]